MLPPINYRLNDFKTIAGWIDKLKLPPVFAWFLKSYLYGFETWWIDHKVKAAVDEAIDDYEALVESDSSIPEPTYFEKQSEVEGLPILGYSYELRDTRSQDEGRLQSLPDTGVERTRSPKTDESTTGDS